MIPSCLPIQHGSTSFSTIYSSKTARASLVFPASQLVSTMPPGSCIVGSIKFVTLLSTRAYLVSLASFQSGLMMCKFLMQNLFVKYDRQQK